MIDQVGYSLINATGAEVAFWGATPGTCVGVPEVIALPNGDQVHSPSAGETFGPFRLVPRVMQYGSQAGTAFNGTATVVTIAAPVVTKADLKTYAASKRYAVETGGCADGQGHTIDTSRESQSKLLAEFVALGAGLRTSGAPWKMKNGAFVSLTNAQMGAVCLAARSHIASAFDVENAIRNQIELGTTTTMAEIDAASWPSNT